MRVLFSLTFWFPNKVLCSSVVHSSAGGGGEGPAENHSAARGRGKTAGRRDSEESGPHLLTAAAPRVPVSYMELCFCVSDMKSKIKQVNLFARITNRMLVSNGDNTFSLLCFQAEIQEASFFLFWPSQKAKSCLLGCSPFLNIIRRWQSWESWLQTCPHWWAETQKR